MKKITTLILLLLIGNSALSQGTDILSAEQFCSGTSQLTYNNVFGLPDDTDVGCLGSIPNASYFFLQVDQPGDLIFTISQEDTGGFPIDVDFIAWGPFTDLNDANANISYTDCAICPNNTTNPAFYPYDPDNITDCSFDIAPTETMNILNAQQGEIYVVLITNFNGDQGTIDFQQTSGNGTTTCANIPICGSNFYDTGGLTGSYFNNENETTTIYPYFTGGTVTVEFTSFNVAAGDILTVYNGPNTTYPVLGTVTAALDSFTSDTATNPTGALTFVFTSNASGTAAGWESDITCTAPPTPPTCGLVFYDSGGAGGNYSNNSFITNTFYPDTVGDAITATFTLFNTENGFDYLYIYDGPNTSAPLLATLTGNQNAALPGPFTSSHPSGAMTFVFISDGSTTRAGWATSLSCAPYVPPTVCGSTFYDTGGASGDYPDDANQTTTFYPDTIGDVLTATFTAFELESCCDELRVYDGPDATAPLLGTFTGNSLPGPFTSSHATGALTFVFESDSSINYLGWAANLTCASSCNLVITDTVYPIGADECSLDYTELTATSGGNSNSSITIFSENFNGGSIPAGWNTNNATANTQWIISNTNNAGGTANEAMLDWITGTGDSGNWILRSPAINIAGETNLQLSFRHYLYHYSNSYPYSIFIQTNLDNAGWVTQSSVLNVNNSIGPAVVNINLSALSGNSLQIRFRMNGNPFGFHYWAIDDVVITADGPPNPSQITWSPTNGLYTDIALTTPYSGSNTDTVYAAPNGTQVYTATDLNNCSDTVSVTHYKKLWDGSENEHWNIADNWTPSGIPTQDNCIVIPGIGTMPILSTTNGTAPIPPTPFGNGKNLTLLDGAYLELDSGTDLTIQDWINVQGNAIFNLKNTSSLIQVLDVTSMPNSGNVHVQRAPKLDFSPVGNLNYVYWSSPVENFNLSQISPNTSPNLIWEWAPTVLGNGTGNHGDWQNISGAMVEGKGYIVRGLSGTPTFIPTTAYPVSNNTALFSGVPNNGEIGITINRGNWTTGDYTGNGNTATVQDDNWNLLGNPYPSSISANDFVTNNTNISGTIYLWPHESLPGNYNDPFYEDFVLNYDNEYIQHNPTGTIPPTIGDIYITSGQAFLTLMLDTSDPNDSNENVVYFNNSLRNGTQPNDAFYRQSEETSEESNLEKHRIWLDLVSSDNQAHTLLVGYIENATNDIDRLFDGFNYVDDQTNFYSLIDESTFSIQGRSLPFLQDDTVQLGITIQNNDLYKIGINTIDGLFENENQNIFLEDTYLNSIHDLKNSPYSFTAISGTYNDRFILRYTNETLGVNDPEFNAGLNIISYNNEVKVTSTNNPINTIEVYDVLGRTIATYKDVNTLEFIFNLSNMSNGTFIVKATLYNDHQKVKKIVH